MLKAALFLLAGLGTMLASTPNMLASTPNWIGKYAPCDRHGDLLERGHVDLSVRISTANTALARQFEKAMEFWSGIVDIEWHEVSGACAIQVVDGTPELFYEPGTTARSQFPDRAAFQGWIAFNPAIKLTDREMFLISVHEIGHLLGLSHNPSGESVMFFLDLDGPVVLDNADLIALAKKHTLRGGVVPANSVKVTYARAAEFRGAGFDFKTTVHMGLPQ